MEAVAQSVVLRVSFYASAIVVAAREGRKSDIRDSRSINHRSAADAGTMPPLSWKKAKLGMPVTPIATLVARRPDKGRVVIEQWNFTVKISLLVYVSNFILQHRLFNYLTFTSIPRIYFIIYM